MRVRDDVVGDARAEDPASLGLPSCSEHDEIGVRVQRAARDRLAEVFTIDRVMTRDTLAKQDARALDDGLVGRRLARDRGAKYLDAHGRRQRELCQNIDRGARVRRSVDDEKHATRRVVPRTHDEQWRHTVMRQRARNATEHRARQLAASPRSDDEQVGAVFQRDRLRDVRGVTGTDRRRRRDIARAEAPARVRDDVERVSLVSATGSDQHHLVRARERECQQEVLSHGRAGGTVRGEDDAHAPSIGPSLAAVRCPLDQEMRPCGSLLRVRRDIRSQGMAGQVAELEAYRSGARALAARILSAQEAERVRVSRELHDDTGQALTLILVRLQLIEDLTREPEVRRELAELRQLVVDTLDGVRRLAVQLGPSVLEDLGLQSGLEWLADRVREETGLRIELDLRCEDIFIPSPVAVAIFRVAQEALTNVVRHAAASRVRMRLEHVDEALVLEIVDDGRGFDVAAARARPAASVGLFGMAERVALVGGTIEIRSTRGAGSRIGLRIPMREGVRT